MIAAGIGCRAGCSVEQVVLALTQALAAAGRTIDEVRALYTAEFKATEAGLLRAAELLDKPLVALPLEQLKAHASATLTASARISGLFGLPSVAETAALAGASGFAHRGARSRLLGPRHVSGDAACALAIAVCSSKAPAEHGT